MTTFDQVRAQFHALWTANVNQANYNKDAWMKMDNLIHDLNRQQFGTAIIGNEGGTADAFAAGWDGCRDQLVKNAHGSNSAVCSRAYTAFLDRKRP